MGLNLSGTGSGSLAVVGGGTAEILAACLRGSSGERRPSLTLRRRDDRRARRGLPGHLRASRALPDAEQSRLNPPT